MNGRCHSGREFNLYLLLCKLPEELAVERELLAWGEPLPSPRAETLAEDSLQVK
jgi:hypothetical protein